MYRANIEAITIANPQEPITRTCEKSICRGLAFTCAAMICASFCFWLSLYLGPETLYPIPFFFYIRFLIASATGLVHSATSTAYIAKLPTASLR